MQAVNKSGVFGEVQPFDNDGLNQLMQDPNTDRVEVFEGTPERLKRRKKMTGKKYSVKPAYRKAPKVKKKSSGCYIHTTELIAKNLNK